MRQCLPERHLFIRCRRLSSGRSQIFTVDSEAQPRQSGLASPPDKERSLCEPVLNASYLRPLRNEPQPQQRIVVAGVGILARCPKRSSARRSAGHRSAGAGNRCVRHRVRLFSGDSGIKGGRSQRPECAHRALLTIRASEVWSRNHTMPKDACFCDNHAGPTNAVSPRTSRWCETTANKRGGNACCQSHHGARIERGGLDIGQCH